MVRHKNGFKDTFARRRKETLATEGTQEHKQHEYVCAMLGNLAVCRFYEGDVVVATLRFSTHEYQGQTFQEVLATDIVKINK